MSEFTNTVDQYTEQELMEMLLSGKLTEFNDDVITTLADYAFAHQRALTSVNLPNVTSIGLAAFWDMPALTDLSLPSLKSLEAPFSDVSFYKTVLTYESLSNVMPRLSVLDLRSLEQVRDVDSSSTVAYPLTLREILFPPYEDVLAKDQAAGSVVRFSVWPHIIGPCELMSLREIHYSTWVSSRTLHLQGGGPYQNGALYPWLRHLTYHVIDMCGTTPGVDNHSLELDSSCFGKGCRSTSNYGAVIVSNEVAQAVRDETNWCDIPNLFAVPQEQLALFDKGDYAYSLEGYTVILPRMLHRCREFYNTNGDLSDLWSTSGYDESAGTETNTVRSELAAQTDDPSLYTYEDSTGVTCVRTGTNVTFAIGETYLVNCFGKEYGVIATEAGLVCYDEYEGVRYAVIQIAQADGEGNNAVTFKTALTDDGVDLSLYTLCDHVLAVYKKEA